MKELPKLSLGLFPTPCYPLESVSARYGRDIWIKRDDLCGVALGGNKIRKLEYLLAEAQNGGCDTVFTTGSAQSNHAMLTAACAARLGMRCVLFLKERGVTDARGNLLLDKLYGAEVRFFDTDQYSYIYDQMLALDEELSAQGHKCCAIPVGGSTPLGAVGYVGCAEEIAAQCDSVGHIVSAVGSGGTAAGLLLGAKLYLPGARLTGVSVYPDAFEDIVPQLAESAAGLLDASFTRSADDFRVVSRIGGGYGIPNPADTPYIEELARLEGILLDPIYTGKAWAGMLELLKEGAFSGDGSIVFVHTGGTAALFALDLPQP
ncbi:MAG: D-cysteine desulfhydrase family protein [Oscillibacter sp.]|nr:D-cysteine desulfhydrase family protein [Oscillibacter sp.]MBQ7680942.1 D-cysteine desulfhydrase family protein [Oscillibacter sp.]MBQ9617372.1 D-cysteine desulfhydrase family protein [Oscillibacter sp.]